MTDEQLALSILTKIANDPTDWTVDRGGLPGVPLICIEATWVTVTPEEADFLDRINPYR